ncbi:MAG: DUF4369 domain-containing protein [Bacteroidales bacterium]|nr:DUF4369 domain-containing protein [Bacteroidales bacterium]
MRLVKVWISICSICLLVSCQHKGQIGVSGHLTNCRNGFLYFSEIRPDGPEFIDSVPITNGDFEFKINSSDKLTQKRRATPFFLQITLDNKNLGFTTSAKNGENLVLSGDAMNFTKSYSISGSTEAENMLALDRQLSLFIDSTDYLYAIYEDNIDNDEVRAQVENAYVQIAAHHTEFLRSFIARHPHSFASMAAFYQRYNRHIFLDEKENEALLEKLFLSLSEVYPVNENVLFLKQRLEKIEAEQENQ